MIGVEVQIRQSVPLPLVLVLLLGACAGDETVVGTSTGEVVVSADVRLGEPYRSPDQLPGGVAWQQLPIPVPSCIGL